MKLLFKNILFLGMILTSLSSLPCDCECKGDCSFVSVSKEAEFIALVKVIKYSDYIKIYTDDSEKSIPLSMTVEVIKKYKGKEIRRKIKIWGDDGVLCRPYTFHFNIGSYYLIAPQRIKHTSDTGKENDYEFFICWTDNLKVDYKEKMIFGKYSKRKNKISLKNFEKEFYN